MSVCEITSQIPSFPTSRRIQYERVTPDLWLEAVWRISVGLHDARAFVATADCCLQCEMLPLTAAAMNVSEIRPISHFDGQVLIAVYV